MINWKVYMWISFSLILLSFLTLPLSRIENLPKTIQTQQNQAMDQIFTGTRKSKGKVDSDREFQAGQNGASGIK